jgi:hypothetical protein
MSSLIELSDFEYLQSALATCGVSFKVEHLTTKPVGRMKRATDIIIIYSAGEAWLYFDKSGEMLFKESKK